jgi:acetoacetate decarboxylase
MGFVKTPEEIARIERLTARPEFVNGERLAVAFLTTPQTVRRLLPPPLEPAATPLVVVGIGRWQSRGVGDYAGCSLNLAARHGTVEGGYALAMWMDTEPAVVFGRDVFGEPKKLANARLFRDGDRFRAHLERHGTRLVEIEADISEWSGPSREERIAFNFRSRPAADGVGLDGPAVLTRATFTTEVKRGGTGTGSIVLRGTDHDPLDEIEIVSVAWASFQEHDVFARCEAVDSVPADRFLPYHHGRNDNWLALDTAGDSALETVRG